MATPPEQQKALDDLRLEILRSHAELKVSSPSLQPSRHYPAPAFMDNTTGRKAGYHMTAFLGGVACMLWSGIAL